MLQELQSPVDPFPAIREKRSERDLMDRIVASPAFVRSPRLSHFLTYICNEAAAGRQGEISEQSIGIAVFGRDPDYDPTIDSIVRSHATRLRQRLREYFETEGNAEQIVLTIPKGSYVPYFEPKKVFPESVGEVSALISTPAVKVRTHSPTVLENEALSPIHPMELNPRVEPAQNSNHSLRFFQAVAIVLFALCSALGLILWRQHLATAHLQNHPFWSEFLSPANHVMVVEADSGLVMLQHLTGRSVSLDQYIGSNYMKDVSSATASDAVALKLGNRRYTPAIDTEIYTRISRLIPGSADHVTLRFARDLRLDELKEGNAFLMGSHESNPWVALYESSMNFRFRGDLVNGIATIVNEHPKPGEQSEYAMVNKNNEQIVYGLLAYRPNLDHVGHVIIVEGQTMAGTQTASDFLFNDSQLLPFLKSIERKNAIPPFEVLLRSSSLNGQSAKNEIIAYRTETD